jgi:hypothetical protein
VAVLNHDGIALLLPVVLAVHNAEEFAQYDRFARTFQGRIPSVLTTRKVSGGAMLLVTVAAAALAGAAHCTESEPARAAVKVAVFAIAWNALGHGVLSLRERAVLPGTVTALLVVLPYGVLAVHAMREQDGDSARRLLFFALTGAVALPTVVLAAAALSYGALRVTGLHNVPSTG